MEIIITNTISVKDFQDEFQKAFPYLKIEFFKTSLKPGTQILKQQPISGRMLLSTVGRINNEGSIDINSSRSVGELELDFRDGFGLNAQVFRKSGTLWIETTLTEHWSLTRQNLEGQQMS